MAWADFETAFKAVCKHVNESYKSCASNTPNIVGTADSLADGLDVLTSDGRASVVAAIAAERALLVQLQAGWKAMMLPVLAYGGTQLTTPSEWVKGNTVSERDLPKLLRDINSYMLANTLSVADRAVTWASEIAASDNGILDRLTVDEYGITIESGFHGQTLDAVVDSIPARYRSVVRVKPRNSGEDVFNLLGPSGSLAIEAVNDANGGDGVVSNPTLSGANTTTDEAAVTTCSGNWTLSSPAGSPTHVWDTGIVYRGLTGSHKMYGNSTTRRWSQPLVVADAYRYTPRNYMLAVYKTGTPVGNITVTWGGKSQVFTMGGLSSGWNYLRLDRDRDLFPSQFAASDATLQADFEFTSGSDASNYINLCFFGGQNYKRYDGAWYGHWSRNGVATLHATLGTMADSMTTAGKNQTALFLALHKVAGHDAYLRHSGSPTLADYT